MFQKENNYDKLYQLANSKTGLQIALFKAITAVESEFNADFKTAFEPRKFGLMGITEYAASRVYRALRKDLGRVDPHGLRDPEVNIRVGSTILRFIYHYLNEGNANMIEVVAEWGALNASGGGEFVRKVMDAYWYYSQKQGEPAGVLPNEVEGVRISVPNLEDAYL